MNKKITGIILGGVFIIGSTLSAWASDSLGSKLKAKSASLSGKGSFGSLITTDSIIGNNGNYSQETVQKVKAMVDNYNKTTVKNYSTYLSSNKEGLSLKNKLNNAILEAQKLADSMKEKEPIVAPEQEKVPAEEKGEEEKVPAEEGGEASEGSDEEEPSEDIPYEKIDDPETSWVYDDESEKWIEVDINGDWTGNWKWAEDGEIHSSGSSSEEEEGNGEEIGEDDWNSDENTNGSIEQQYHWELNEDGVWMELDSDGNWTGKTSDTDPTASTEESAVEQQGCLITIDGITYLTNYDENGNLTSVKRASSGYEYSFDDLDSDVLDKLREETKSFYDANNSGTATEKEEKVEDTSAPATNDEVIAEKVVIDISQEQQSIDDYLTDISNKENELERYQSYLEDTQKSFEMNKDSEDTEYVQMLQDEIESLQRSIEATEKDISYYEHEITTLKATIADKLIEGAKYESNGYEVEYITLDSMINEDSGEELKENTGNELLEPEIPAEEYGNEVELQ